MTNRLVVVKRTRRTSGSSALARFDGGFQERRPPGEGQLRIDEAEHVLRDVDDRQIPAEDSVNAAPTA
jgi:hypothetical protein